MKYQTVWQLKQTEDRKRNRDIINTQGEEIILSLLFPHTGTLRCNFLFLNAPLYVKCMRNLIMTLILTKEGI